MPISLKANSDGSAEILNGVNKVLDISQDGWLGGKNIQGYNYIINGNFDIWQRGTSQTTTGYGSDDRWVNANEGSTKTHSRQVFGVGGVFSDGTLTPQFFSRTIVSSVTGANNACNKQIRLEDVTLLAGRKVTLAFYARADAPRSISVEFGQIFGTGGSPSENVLGIGVEKISLTNTFQRYVIKCELPSVLGKVLGTDNNSATQINFWFDAGSNFNSRTDSLGHQSGTFDIACISLVEGDVDIKPIPRSYGEELSLCQRYYNKVFPGRVNSFGLQGYNSAASNISVPYVYSTRMRAVPFTSVVGSITYINANQFVINAPSEISCLFITVALATGMVSVLFNANAFVEFDAEL